MSRWTGGITYYDNLLTAIHLADDPPKNTLVGLIPNRDQSLNNLLHHFGETSYLPSSSLTEKFLNRASIWMNNHQNLAGFAPESDISRASRRIKAEVVFLKQDPCANFCVPSVCWFPDFQYLHMPEMFDPIEAENYDRTARRIGRYATHVMLSSQAAQKDFGHLVPEYKDKVRVIPFAAWIHDDIYSENVHQIQDEYHLPEKFFYLPNQFWKHKNHQVVLDALEICLRSEPTLTVAAGGSLSDFRNPNYPSEFVAEIARRGLRGNFILLGLIPRKDVYGLMRQSLAILQPSLFEGWSTSVEEAKSLGKQLIVSDLDVHREQSAPNALYFNPQDPQELAKILLEVHRNSKPGVDLRAEGRARESMRARVKAFGTSFLDLMMQAARR
jgi:glycosyltransferase involved in cell wall biosynthesis